MKISPKSEKEGEMEGVEKGGECRQLRESGEGKY